MSEQNDALLTEDDFNTVGANDIAYVRPFVQEEKVHFILVAGDGRQQASRRIIGLPLQLRSKTTSSRSAFIEIQIVEV